MGKILFIGVVGSRRRDSENDKLLVLEKVKSFSELSEVILVSGGCKKGADRFAEEIAEELGLKIILFLPELSNCKHRWEFTNEYFKRNKLISEKSDVLIACVSADRKGGTEHTIKEYQKLGKDKCIIL
jgi:predicted Rossmann fold nucleotide-binding protein DprA/Smf involved in DNA uptake